VEHTVSIFFCHLSRTHNSNPEDLIRTDCKYPQFKIFNTYFRVAG